MERSWASLSYRSGDLAELPMIEERLARFLARRLRILYTRKII
jgi:hypothetical protein